jgi:hypothetical protein
LLHFKKILNKSDTNCGTFVLYLSFSIRTTVIDRIEMMTAIENCVTMYSWMYDTYLDTRGTESLIMFKRTT